MKCALNSNVLGLPCCCCCFLAQVVQRPWTFCSALIHSQGACELVTVPLRFFYALVTYAMKLHQVRGL
jgi:hypothetical protein